MSSQKEFNDGLRDGLDGKTSSASGGFLSDLVDIFTLGALETDHHSSSYNSGHDVGGALRNAEDDD